MQVLRVDLLSLNAFEKTGSPKIANIIIVLLSPDCGSLYSFRQKYFIDWYNNNTIPYYLFNCIIMIIILLFRSLSLHIFIQLIIDISN